MQPIIVQLVPRPSAPPSPLRTRGDGKASVPKSAVTTKQKVDEELSEDTASNTTTKAPGLY